MADQEFEENAGLFAAGEISRRTFINRLVGGGASVVAALAFVNANATAAFASRRGDKHKHCPPNLYGHYGHYGNDGMYGHYGKPAKHCKPHHDHDHDDDDRHDHHRRDHDDDDRESKRSKRPKL